MQPGVLRPPPGDASAAPTRPAPPARCRVRRPPRHRRRGSGRPLRRERGVGHPPPQLRRIHNFASVGNGTSGFGITNGAPVMLSTPPAMTRSASPEPTARAASDDRLATGTAQPVDGDTGHGHRQTGQQHRHPGHVAVVLAGPVGVTENNVVDPVSMASAGAGAGVRLSAARRGHRYKRPASPPPMAAKRGPDPLEEVASTTRR